MHNKDKIQSMEQTQRKQIGVFQVNSTFTVALEFNIL